jgi:hypothetical protein
VIDLRGNSHVLHEGFGYINRDSDGQIHSTARAATRKIELARTGRTLVVPAQSDCGTTLQRLQETGQPKTAVTTMGDVTDLLFDEGLLI